MAARPPKVLLLHEGELAEVGELLRVSGIRFGELDPADPRSAAAAPREGPEAPTPRPGADLVVGCGHCLLALGSSPARSGGTTVAVLGMNSHSLRDELRLAGVDYVVSQPVEARALRLLMLRLLYRGPERRQSERIGVDDDVQLRVGFRRRPAVLVDLSESGCSVLSTHPVGFGRTVAVGLPPELAHGAELWLRGRVARVGPPASDEPGVEEIGVRFDALEAESLDRLREILGSLTSARLSPPKDPPPPVSGGGDGRADPAVRAVEEDFDARWRDTLERRAEPRRLYPRRVISLGPGFANVVIGRDLSRGGMRIEPTPSLFVGDALRVALYGTPDRPPLVVSARVQRDDGPQGLVLAFPDVSDAEEIYMGGILDALPNLERLSRGAARGLFVSELLPPA